MRVQGVVRNCRTWNIQETLRNIHEISRASRKAHFPYFSCLAKLNWFSFITALRVVRNWARWMRLGKLDKFLDTFDFVLLTWVNSITICWFSVMFSDLHPLNEIVEFIATCRLICNWFEFILMQGTLFLIQFVKYFVRWIFFVIRPFSTILFLFISFLKDRTVRTYNQMISRI